MGEASEGATILPEVLLLKDHRDGSFDQWRKEGRIVALLAERLDIDTERALDILYNLRTYALLSNPDSGLQLQSDEYFLNNLLQELERCQEVSRDCPLTPRS